MGSYTILCLIAAGGLAAATFAQNAPRVAPVPDNAFELVTGPVQAAASPASRDAALQLLARARSHFALRGARLPYDLKVTFTVDSGGQTLYDGAWEMEDISDPKLGLRWTAKSSSGYSTTQIASLGSFYGEYGEAAAGTIPLRLHEARAALFDPIPSAASVEHDSIRTSTAAYKGVQLTCILLSDPRNAAAATVDGRRWEEAEECIDPQTGFLQIHSQTPGRYFAYDYSGGPQLGSSTLPRKIIVSEAGKTVTEISVQSLQQTAAVDANLFAPTKAMRAAGPPPALAAAQKIWRFVRTGSDTTVRPVCIFGLVTPAGQLVEAHSLQPSDPNSSAALDVVAHMNFAAPTRAGTRPQQHFVLVIAKFVSPQTVAQ